MPPAETPTTATPVNMSLRDALAQYQSRISILKKGAPQERYRILRMQQAPLADKIVRDITSVDIATYRDQRLLTINPKTDKPLASSTVRLELALLSHLFEVGQIEWGICDGNPVAKVRKPKLPPGRERRLTPREERRIMRYCHAHPNPELGAIITIALETAMRQGEILKLDWQHINLRSRIARLPDTKNGTIRDVPLSLKARDVLVSMGTKPAGRVFSYSNAGVKSSWRFMILKLGIEDLHFHDLRHSAVSALFELGTLDVMEVAAISGHKSLAMLKRYTHLAATKLVQKLEGQKHRGRATVLSSMIPYPALVTDTDGKVQVRFLDFEGLVVLETTRHAALTAARDLLMRHLLQSMRDGTPIPAPDQYLEAVSEKDLEMIDPLASAPLRQNFTGSINEERDKCYLINCLA